MNLIKGIFEIAINVENLSLSTEFYKNVLGFEVGLHDEERKWMFMWLPGRAGLIVLQESHPPWPKQHFAFSIGAKDLKPVVTALFDAAVEVDGPVDHEWMGVRSYYFPDPNGHDVELCIHQQNAHSANK